VLMGAPPHSIAAFSPHRMTMTSVLQVALYSFVPGFILLLSMLMVLRQLHRFA